ncbi:MAG: class I SAM-dependent methyltransferase [Proteobacteria bacterium]|nr:class I SAM-dependent methyltransferase [Pseudomonadota bacterium]
MLQTILWVGAVLIGGAVAFWTGRYVINCIRGKHKQNNEKGSAIHQENHIIKKLNKVLEISAVDVNVDEVVSPEKVDRNRSPTLNGTGYIFYPLTPIGKAFVTNEAQKNKKVIEIGAGFSDLSIETLRKGILKYTANDMSEAHLKMLVKRVKETLSHDTLLSLTLIPAKAPQELPTAKQEYDAIIAEKVIHFMKPDEIIEFLNWCKMALKEGGKLYITVASPYSKAYQKMLPDYLKRQKDGVLMAGHFQHMTRDMDLNAAVSSNSKYKVPDEMVLFGRKNLEKLVESQGMEVISSCALRIPLETENEWALVEEEESNVVGVIAKCKPS